MPDTETEARRVRVQPLLFASVVETCESCRDRVATHHAFPPRRRKASVCGRCLPPGYADGD